MAYVYVFQSGDEDLFKIGKTKRDVADRGRQLATGNPRRLVLFDSIETEDASRCETYLHGKLSSRRVAGQAREFFQLTPFEMADAIKDAREYIAEDLPRQRIAEELALSDVEGGILLPDELHRHHHRELLRHREARYCIEVEITRHETALKLAIGTAEGIDGVATWRSFPRSNFDQEAFREAEPEMYQAFLRHTRFRQFRLL